MKKINAILLAAAVFLPSAAFALPQPKVVGAYVDGRMEAVLEIGVNRGFETASQNGNKDWTLSVTAQVGINCAPFHVRVFGSDGACDAMYGNFTYPLTRTLQLSSAEVISFDKSQALVRVRFSLHDLGLPVSLLPLFTIKSASATLN